MKMVVCLALFSAPVLASSDACTGGNWHKPNVAVPTQSSAEAEYDSVNPERQKVSPPQNICDDQEVSDMPSGRIPPLCIQGKTNTRFQMWPGVLDFVIHYANKYRITGWLKHVLSMVRAVLRF